MACRHIEQFGADRAVDFFLLKFFENNKVFPAPHLIFHLNPLMSYQLHEEGDNFEIDKKSDIQNDTEKFKALDLKKIIHQSWKTKDIPYEVYKKEWVDSWSKLNPEWEYKLWTDEDNRNLIKDYYPQYLELYDSYERAIAKADIARLFYLHKFGGLYVDLDFKCLKPIDSIIVPEHINLGEQKTKEYQTNSIANALMYSPPDQDFWLKCADELINHKFTNGKLSSTEAATGPIFLYNCLEKFKPQNLTIHDSGVFYPISWEINGSAISKSLEQKWLDNPEQCFPDSYAITYWSGGWRLKIKTLPKINFIWQTKGGRNQCFEYDWIVDLFSSFDINHIDDGEFCILKDNSVIIYSDMMCENLSIYNDSIAESESIIKERRRQYFEKFNNRKSFLVHLSDEHCHAAIDHYKYFDHVFRQYFRADAQNENLTFIPLGYKQGFTKIDKNSDIRFAKEKFEEARINNKINLHYWPGMAGKKNFGDEMSSYIMKKLLPFNEFSYNVNPQECKVNLIALGSYIQMAKDDYYIFGSGVRKANDRSNYKKLNVISVRGPKSRDFLISKGVACPELYGDPGLFISRYYSPTIDYSLKGKIGVVPHITDKTNYNKNNSDKFHIIDPCQHWMKVIDQICSCESIVSSSLHGLICADAYNIPNAWMEYKLLEEGDFKFIDYFLSQGREIKKISSLEDISNDIFYKGGNNINLDKLSEALYSSSLNKKNNKEEVNISLINPTAITRDNKQYTLYRGEKYLKGKPPPIGFYRSELSYWLECGGVKKQCVFDFGEYSYKTIRRIDIEKKSNKSIIEDLRFIESSIKQTKNGLTCLATCTLLPHVTIYHGTKNKNGEFDKSKGIGLAYAFKMAYCEVNLTHGTIKYKGIINPESQIKNEKNWASFIHNNNFFVIYSMSPLVYSKASSLEEIKFKKTNLPDKLDFHCSTNPINIGGDKFAMLCHIRNRSKDFYYNYQLVTFNILNGEIININKFDINVDPKLYCSSIILDNNKIKVLAGKEDLGNSSFYINIPRYKQGFKDE